MHIILDTHLLLWALYDSNRLPKGFREIVEDDDTDIEYSIVSLWETEIKHNKFPEEYPFNCDDLFRDAQMAGLHMLDLKPMHIGALGGLNKPKEKHNDPFDRMLIAQAKSENSYLVTHDKKLDSYNEECVSCI